MCVQVWMEPWQRWITAPATFPSECLPAPPPASAVPITLFDDAIDEAESEFFVLFLESDNARVDLTGRFAALATIRDNEGERGGKPLPCAHVRGIVGQPQSHTVGEGLASPQSHTVEEGLATWVHTVAVPTYCSVHGNQIAVYMYQPHHCDVPSTWGPGEVRVVSCTKHLGAGGGQGSVMYQAPGGRGSVREGGGREEGGRGGGQGSVREGGREGGGGGGGQGSVREGGREGGRREGGGGGGGGQGSVREGGGREGGGREGGGGGGQGW